jgi:hypothetical protein
VIRPSIKGQRLVAVFLLGLLLLNYPILHLLEKHGDILGIPVLFAYVFAVWAALIALMALILEKRGD